MTSLILHPRATTFSSVYFHQNCPEHRTAEGFLSAKYSRGEVGKLRMEVSLMQLEKGLSSEYCIFKFIFLLCV